MPPGRTNTGVSTETDLEVLSSQVAVEYKESQRVLRDQYQAISTQFTNVVLIATFTGGVEAAVLSLFNDILSNGALKLKAFSVPIHSSSRETRLGDLGIALGTFSVTLNVAVAAVSAVNVMLSGTCTLDTAFGETARCYTSLEVFLMRARRCMHLQLSAFIIAGISIMTLCTLISTSLAVSVALSVLLAIWMSAIDLVRSLLYGRVRWRKLLLVLLTMAVNMSISFLDVLSRSPCMAVTISAQVLLTYAALSALLMSPLYSGAPIDPRGFSIGVFGAYMYPCITNVAYLVDAAPTYYRSRVAVYLTLGLTVVQFAVLVSVWIRIFPTSTFNGWKKIGSSSDA